MYHLSCNLEPCWAPASPASRRPPVTVTVTSMSEACTPHTHIHTHTHTHTHTLRGRGSEGKKGQATRTKAADRSCGRLPAGKDTTQTVARAPCTCTRRHGARIDCLRGVADLQRRARASRLPRVAWCVLRASGAAVNLPRARPQQEPPLLPHRASCCQHAPHRSCAAPPPPRQRVSAPAPPGIFVSDQ